MQVISRPQMEQTLPDGVMATLSGMASNFAPASFPAPFFMGLHYTSLRKHLHFIGIWWFATKWTQARGDWTHTLQQQAMVNHCCILFSTFIFLTLKTLRWAGSLMHAVSGVRAHSVACSKTTTYAAFQKLKQLGGLNVPHFCHTFIPLHVLVPLPKTPFLFPAQSVFRS